MSVENPMPGSNEPTWDDIAKWDRVHNLKPWASMDSWREDDPHIVDYADGV